jgi:hypothetical protein
MPTIGRLKSAMRGMLWLVRGGGLRTRLYNLDDRLSRLETGLAALPDSHQVAGLGRSLEALQRTSEQAQRLAANDLRAFEKRVCSQNGEDGILAEIFHRIGTTNRYFVEFGVQTGAECNCAHLAINEKWSGLFIEAHPPYYAALAERYRSYPGVTCLHQVVTSANIERLLAAQRVPLEFELLSIDIDGNDYWVWAAIRNWRPRVVVIEYNASYPPPRRWVMKENSDHRWDGTTYFGASLASLAALGREKGYDLVGTDSNGVNAFFVRRDLIEPGPFLDAMTFYHYSPPRYGPCNGSHPPRSGPHLVI